MHLNEHNHQASMTPAQREPEVLRMLRFGWINLLVGIVFGIGVSTQAFAIQQSNKAEPSTNKAETSVAAPHPLSVPPLEISSRKYPDDRPEWISQPPELEGIVHRWPVCSIPSINEANAEQDLKEQARAAVRAYIRDQLPDCRPTVIDSLIMDDKWLSELMDPDKSYRGMVTTDDGNWHEVATQLVFRPEFREEVQRQHKQIIVGDRMKGLIALVGFATVSLASLSTILRVIGGRRESVAVR